MLLVRCAAPLRVKTQTSELVEDVVEHYAERAAYVFNLSHMFNILEHRRKLNTLTGSPPSPTVIPCGALERTVFFDEGGIMHGTGRVFQLPWTLVDLLAHCTDHDLAPWRELLGATPHDAVRDAFPRGRQSADLVLSGEDGEVLAALAVVTLLIGALEHVVGSYEAARAR